MAWQRLRTPGPVRAEPGRAPQELPRGSCGRTVTPQGGPSVARVEASACATARIGPLGSPERDHGRTRGPNVPKPNPLNRQRSRVQGDAAISVAYAAAAWLRRCPLRSLSASSHRGAEHPRVARSASPRLHDFPRVTLRRSSHERGTVRRPLAEETPGKRRASSRPRASPATRAASVKSVPGWESKSMRSSSGWSTSSRRTGHGWKVIVPICAAQATTAASVGHTSSAY